MLNQDFYGESERYLETKMNFRDDEIITTSEDEDQEMMGLDEYKELPTDALTENDVSLSDPSIAPKKISIVIKDQRNELGSNHFTTQD